MLVLTFTYTYVVSVTALGAVRKVTPMAERTLSISLKPETRAEILDVADVLRCKVVVLLEDMITEYKERHAHEITQARTRMEERRIRNVNRSDGPDRRRKSSTTNA